MFLIQIILPILMLITCTLKIRRPNTTPRHQNGTPQNGPLQKATLRLITILPPDSGKLRLVRYPFGNLGPKTCASETRRATVATDLGRGRATGRATKGTAHNLLIQTFHRFRPFPPPIRPPPRNPAPVIRRKGISREGGKIGRCIGKRTCCGLLVLKQLGLVVAVVAGTPAIARMTTALEQRKS